MEKERDLKPFGVEYLEAIEVPATGGEAMDDMGGDCCATFMSTLSSGSDVGGFTCVNDVDNPCVAL